MVNPRSGRYERIGARYGAWLVRGFGIIIILLVCLCFFALQTRQLSTFRHTIVLAGTPMHIWSWDIAKNTFVDIQIPADTIIDAVRGYGRYSLEALWKFGSIDRNESFLAVQSLEEVLGLPIAWYIGPSDLALPHESDSRGAATGYFSFQKIVAFFSGKFRTNIPPSLFMQLVWKLLWVRPDSVVTLDLSRLDSGSLVDLPDGTHVYVLDPDRLDVLFGNTFEDERIRKEARSVGVFNTTSMPTLGNRLARLLGHVGVLVVTVGNDTPMVDRCVVSGTKDNLQSLTAQFLIALLDCRKWERDEGGRADIVVRLGSDYRQRFLPSRKL